MILTRFRPALNGARADPTADSAADSGGWPWFSQVSVRICCRWGLARPTILGLFVLLVTGINRGDSRHYGVANCVDCCCGVFFSKPGMLLAWVFVSVRCISRDWMARHGCIWRPLLRCSSIVSYHSERVPCLHGSVITSEQDYFYGIDHFSALSPFWTRLGPAFTGTDIHRLRVDYLRTLLASTFVWTMINNIVYSCREETHCRVSPNADGLLKESRLLVRWGGRWKQDIESLCYVSSGIKSIRRGSWCIGFASQPGDRLRAALGWVLWTRQSFPTVPRVARETAPKVRVRGRGTRKGSKSNEEMISEIGVCFLPRTKGTRNRAKHWNRVVGATWNWGDERYQNPIELGAKTYWTQPRSQTICDRPLREWTNNQGSWNAITNADPLSIRHVGPFPRHQA